MTVDIGELTRFQETIVLASFIGGTVGGFIGQLAMGAVYLKKVVSTRCINHAARLEVLEGVRK